MPWPTRIQKRSSLLSITRTLDPAVIAFEVELARAFFRGINGIRGFAADTTLLQAAITSGNPQSVLDLFTWLEFEDRVTRDITATVQDIIQTYGTDAFDNVITNAERAVAGPAIASGGSGGRALPPNFAGMPPPRPGGRGAFKADLRFDMTNPLAVQRAERYAGDLVREVTAATRAAIQEVVGSSFRNGMRVEDLAAALKNTVGLTAAQARAVEAYRTRATVTQGADRANALTDRYYRQTLNRRVTTIARTEVMRASNQGRLDGWLSAADAGVLDRVNTRKRWISAGTHNKHGAPCEMCWPMNGVEVVGLETEFMLPNGYGTQMPPAHPNCRCTAVALPPEVPGDFHGDLTFTPTSDEGDAVPAGATDVADLLPSAG